MISTRHKIFSNIGKKHRKQTKFTLKRQTIGGCSSKVFEHHEIFFMRPKFCCWWKLMGWSDFEKKMNRGRWERSCLIVWLFIVVTKGLSGVRRGWKLIVTKVDCDKISLLQKLWRMLVVMKVDCDESWLLQKLIVTSVDCYESWLWRKFGQEPAWDPRPLLICWAILCLATQPGSGTFFSSNPSLKIEKLQKCFV